MSQWLCLSSDYHNLHISLCSTNKIIASCIIDKKNGNQRLLSDIDTLLKAHNLELSDITFIGINLGPAPYTSLRIAIATANGLHAATGIPLVGIDALKAFVQGHEPTSPHQATVAISNAFNHDLFYAIALFGTDIQTGYLKDIALFEYLKQTLNNVTICWLGNGVAMYPDEVQELNVHIANMKSIPDYPSQEQLVEYAWHHWQQKNCTFLALPLYLKKIVV